MSPDEVYSPPVSTRPKKDLGSSDSPQGPGTSAITPSVPAEVTGVFSHHKSGWGLFSNQTLNGV